MTEMLRRIASHPDNDEIDHQTFLHHNRMKNLNERRSKIMLGILFPTFFFAGGAFFTDYHYVKICGAIVLIGFMATILFSISIKKKMAMQTLAFGKYIDTCNVNLEAKGGTDNAR